MNLVSGDILFNRTNSLDLVGKVAVVRGDLPQPISFASYPVRLRVRERQADGFWLASLLGSPSCQAHIRRLATPAVSQANVNPTSLRTLTIPLPPLDEQRAIAGTLDSVDGTIERAREERARLHSLQASATDALLTGRVRAPATAWEVASREVVSPRQTISATGSGPKTAAMQVDSRDHRAILHECRSQ